MKKVTFLRKLKSSVITLSIFSMVFAPTLSAQELVIEGNGSGSDSSINVQSEQETQVTQNNTADIANDVDASANTGNNETSANTAGNTNVTTGNVTTQTNLENNANTSHVIGECCTNSANSFLIASNGSNSNNSIDDEVVNNTSVVVNQNAKITNSIQIRANTGNNRANRNTSSDIAITTGNISVKSAIYNAPVNFSKVKIPQGNVGAITYAKIANNGTSSVNSILAKYFITPVVVVNNEAYVENNVKIDANTGKNEAANNTDGDVWIATGDIDLEVFIKNLINLSEVEISCCAHDEEPESPPTTPTQPTNPQPNVGGPSQNATIPAGAEVSAGGPGVLGLSDTSGRATQALFFWIGLTMMAHGAKIVANEITKKISFKKAQN